MNMITEIKPGFTNLTETIPTLRTGVNHMVEPKYDKKQFHDQGFVMFTAITTRNKKWK